MKQMEYTSDFHTREILDEGIYKKYKYYIISLGTHPVAYVEIPKNNKLYGKNYDNININVHGGLTYSANHLYISENEKINGWFIGWDYAHYDDYIGHYLAYPELFIEEGKKWTTKEILENVKDVIEQIIKLEEE